jgi:hypothetical protein
VESDSAPVGREAPTVRQTIDRKEHQQSQSPPAPEPPVEGEVETTLRKFMPEIVAFLLLEGIAVPFAHPAAEAIMSGDWEKGAVGYSVAAVSGVAGITYHWWKNWSFWKRVKPFVIPLWPAPILLLFFYVAGPAMYRRATAPITPVQAVQSENLFTEQQVNDKIASAVSKSVSNLNSQIESLGRQLAGLLRENNALRSQIQNAPAPSRELDTPRVFTKLTPDQIRAIYQDRTPLQSDILFADEAGKWLANEGKVVTVAVLGFALIGEAGICIMPVRLEKLHKEAAFGLAILAAAGYASQKAKAPLVAKFKA